MIARAFEASQNQIFEGRAVRSEEGSDRRGADDLRPDHEPPIARRADRKLYARSRPEKKLASLRASRRREVVERTQLETEVPCSVADPPAPGVPRPDLRELLPRRASSGRRRGRSRVGYRALHCARGRRCPWRRCGVEHRTIQPRKRLELRRPGEMPIKTMEPERVTSADLLLGDDARPELRRVWVDEDESCQSSPR